MGWASSSGLAWNCVATPTEPMAMTGKPAEVPGPAGQGTVRALEGRPPVPAGRDVEQRDPGVGQRGQEGGQLIGGLRDPGVILPDLPLREAERDREVRADGGPDGRGDFGAEPDPAGDAAAVLIGAAVGGGPVELVEQVAVRAVQLDAVEAGGPGVGGGPREGRGDLGERPRASRLADGLAGGVQARGADHRGVGKRRRAGLALGAEVPQLGKDGGAFGMDRVGDLAPGGEGFGPEETRDAVAAARRAGGRRRCPR